MKRQEELNAAWCKYIGMRNIEIMQALAFALRWADSHPRWISVEDELPPCNQSLYDRHGNPLDYAIKVKVSKPVLVYTNGEILVDRLNQDIEDGKPYGKPYWVYPVTHWMNLPLSPAD